MANYTFTVTLESHEGAKPFSQRRIRLLNQAIKRMVYYAFDNDIADAEQLKQQVVFRVTVAPETAQL